MVKLVMYSDQVIPENRKVDARLLDHLPGPGTRIGYVASGAEPDRRFFQDRRDYYALIGLDLAVFVDLTVADAAARVDLLDCDAIHLSGGDTRAFLRLLKASGLFDPIQSWAQAGGVLIGTSAGAILMTPTVALDVLYEGGDPAAVSGGLALGLVPFEVFPHLNGNGHLLPRLLDYSKGTSRPLAAFRDGDGVVIGGGRAESIGDLVWISNGAFIDAPEGLDIGPASPPV